MPLCIRELYRCVSGASFPSCFQFGPSVSAVSVVDTHDLRRSRCTFASYTSDESCIRCGGILPVCFFVELIIVGLKLVLDFVLAGVWPCSCRENLSRH